MSDLRRSYSIGDHVMTLYRNYTAHGQEVLRNGKHVADTTDPDMARLIAEALNHAPDCCDPARTGTPEPTFAGMSIHVDPDMSNDGFAIGYPIQQFTETDTYYDGIGLAQTVVTSTHHVRQETDEYACKCGMRWPVSDGEEHP
jgi:hypothetical protein